jgi:hypothetical protein
MYLLWVIGPSLLYTRGQQKSGSNVHTQSGIGQGTTVLYLVGKSSGVATVLQILYN